MRRRRRPSSSRSPARAASRTPGSDPDTLTALPDPSILVVHPDRKTQRVVQRILGATGHQIDVAEDIDQAVRLLGAPNRAPALIVVDGVTVLHERAQALIAAATA